MWGSTARACTTRRAWTASPRVVLRRRGKGHPGGCVKQVTHPEREGPGALERIGLDSQTSQLRAGEANEPNLGSWDIKGCKVGARRAG